MRAVWKKRVKLASMLGGLALATRFYCMSSQQLALLEEHPLADPEGDLGATSLSAGDVEGPMREAALVAEHCQAAGEASGEVEVEVRFGANGRAQDVSVRTGRFHGTSTEACLRSIFGRVELPAFDGPTLVLSQVLWVRP